MLSCCDAGMAILTGTGWVAIPSELQHHTPTRGAISLPLGAAAPYPYPWSCNILLPLIGAIPYPWSALPLEYRYPLELLHHTPTLGIPLPLGAAAPYPYPLELRQPSRQGYSRRSVECSTHGQRHHPAVHCSAHTQCHHLLLNEACSVVQRPQPTCQGKHRLLGIDIATSHPPSSR